VTTSPSAAPSTPVDRRAARHEATKREIVAAAWQLSLEHGLAGWALKDVGAAVGMRAPSLYVYFDGKNELYDAMFADGCLAFAEVIRGTVRPADPRAALLLANQVFVDFCVAHPARFQLLFLGTLPGFRPSPESYQLAIAVLDALVTILRDNGVSDQRDVDLWTAVMTGIASQQVSNDPGGTRWSGLVLTALDRLLPPAQTHRA
jgi:AcrR family transcriptional regulator